MKKKIALSLILISTQVHAMKYVIFTDQANTSKAREVVEVMKNTYPFSIYNLTFEIVHVPSTQLDCQSTQTGAASNVVLRLASCNDNAFGARSTLLNGDQAMIIKDSPSYQGFGAAGGVPVITTGTSARAMLHEYMHVLGLCDEYEYTVAQADIYCLEGNTPNTTYIEPRASYANDGEARSAHSSEIPWHGDILRTTPIVSGSQLGTGNVSREKEVPNNTKIPTALAEPVGLFKGRVCKNATVRKTAWVPGGKQTVMENVDAGLGAQMERTVDRHLKAKGAVPKQFGSLQRARPVEPVQIGQINQPAQAVEMETSRAEPVVNDSPRNFFKDFFQSLADLFKGFSRGIGR